MSRRKWKFSMKRAKIDKSVSVITRNTQEQCRSSGTDKQKAFDQFLMLSDDIQITILSYVADAPFEKPEIMCSSLTHVLPYVSKHFASLLDKTDLFWREALTRNLKKERTLWEPGILRFLNEKKEACTEESSKLDSKVRSSSPSVKRKDDLSCNNEKYEDKLVDQVFHHLSNERKKLNENKGTPKQVHSTDAQSFYRKIAVTLNFIAPVFYMQSYPRIGEEFGLHFFEPRYRVLIADVMKNWPSCVNGEPISADEYGNYPCFIYANQNRLENGAGAMVVNVRSCHILRDGRADVTLVPVAHIRLRKVWVRPNSGRLYMASARRLSAVEVERIEDNASQRGIQMSQDWVFEGTRAGNSRGGLASLFQFLVASGHFESADVRVEENRE